MTGEIGRRQCDKRGAPCPHDGQLANHERQVHRLQIVRHALYEWMMISAFLAVIVLTFQVYQSMARVSASAVMMEKAMREQNVMLGSIDRSLKVRPK